MRPKLKPGNLVIISVTGTSYSPDGFVTGPARGKNEILFFELIDLMSYPSCNDFKGNSTQAADGDIATVCRFIGRPFQINPSDSFFYYDVYEILIKGEIRHAFQQNLILLKNRPIKKV